MDIEVVVAGEFIAMRGNQTFRADRQTGQSRDATKSGSQDPCAAPRIKQWERFIFSEAIEVSAQALTKTRNSILRIDRDASVAWVVSFIPRPSGKDTSQKGSGSERRTLAGIEDRERDAELKVWSWFKGEFSAVNPGLVMKSNAGTSECRMGSVNKLRSREAAHEKLRTNRTEQFQKAGQLERPDSVISKHCDRLSVVAEQS